MIIVFRWVLFLISMIFSIFKVFVDVNVLLWYECGDVILVCGLIGYSGWVLFSWGCWCWGCVLGLVIVWC